MSQRIARPLGALISQSHEYWGRSNGNLSANRIKKTRNPRAAERITYLEFLYLIFPAGPETRPAVQENERTLGIRVTDINILCRARIESKNK
jgi:hypothetical protein